MDSLFPRGNVKVSFPKVSLCTMKKNLIIKLSPDFMVPCKHFLQEGGGTMSIQKKLQIVFLGFSVFLTSTLP